MENKLLSEANKYSRMVATKDLLSREHWNIITEGPDRFKFGNNEVELSYFKCASAVDCSEEKQIPNATETFFTQLKEKVYESQEKLEKECAFRAKNRYPAQTHNFYLFIREPMVLFDDYKLTELNNLFSIYGWVDVAMVAVEKDKM